jgi:hypothetical protein
VRLRPTRLSTLSNPHVSQEVGQICAGTLLMLNIVQVVMSTAPWQIASGRRQVTCTGEGACGRSSTPSLRRSWSSEWATFLTCLKGAACFIPHCWLIHIGAIVKQQHDQHLDVIRLRPAADARLGTAPFRRMKHMFRTFLCWVCRLFQTRHHHMKVESSLEVIGMQADPGPLR